MLSPQLNDKYVQILLKKIDAEFDPEIVPIIPEKYSVQSSCFSNVKLKLKRDGGKICYGWAILKGKFAYEAEWHAVWEDTKHDFIDITPRDADDHQIMFVASSTSEYNGEFIDNVRINVTGNLLVDDFLYCAEMLTLLNSKSTRLSDFQVQLSQKLTDEINKSILQRNLYFTYLQSGARMTSLCYCKSGKSYNKCHGPNFRKRLSDRVNKIIQDLD